MILKQDLNIKCLKKRGYKMGSYGLGCKLGRSINKSYWGDKPNKEKNKEKEEQRKYKNTYVTLHGIDSYNNLTDHEKKSRGTWD